MKKIILSFILCMVAGFAFAQSYVTVAGDNVCLRTCASESCKWTGRNAPHFDTGDKLTYYGQSGNYYRVGWNGGTYYLPKKYGRLRGRYENTDVYSGNYNGRRSVIIAGDNVCLRTRPNENSKLVGPGYYHLDTGEVVSYYGSVGNYYKIGVNGGVYYIPKKYGRLR